ncbi:hypothetical protein CEXT_402141 [Caerostris extrusa]|uniref:Uncharacterized protein n=1 Tax=Caerostris extrusa TaxID=172846 RepID=A0AAV4WKM6_CAEEX|nr:hypothetical protein CEXT_402141 [Caerostris extrusa]
MTPASFDKNMASHLRERDALICVGYFKLIKDGFCRGRKTVLGKVSFTILTAMFLIDWFELNVIDVTGLVLLIGFVGKKDEGVWLRLD